MTDVTSARRRVTALLNTQGCTPPEAAQRLAKAAELAERAGIRAEFRQLLRPGERPATPDPERLRAAAEQRMRAAAQAWYDLQMAELHAHVEQRHRMEARRDAAVRAMISGLLAGVLSCLLLNVAGRYAGAHGWPVLGWILWLWSFVTLMTGMFRAFNEAGKALHGSA